MLNLLHVKKYAALALVLVCLFAFSGCQAVLDYVDSYVPPTTPANAETTPAPAPTEPGETMPQETEATQPTIVGVVTGAGVLNVRSGPGVEHDVVGSLEDGTKVAIYEQQKVGESNWGRIKIGWISMNYIVITETKQSQTEITSSIIATVVTENLNIRGGPSTSYGIADNLTTGDKVQITEVRIMGETLWGKVNKGWVCMDYVKIDGNSDGGLRISGTVNTDQLMIRTGAGTDFEAVGSYGNQEKVVVTQLKAVGYVPWGKTDKGWICMNFVIPDGNISVTAG